MFEIRPRETVILATNFTALVDWYETVLGITITNIVEDDFHSCNLEMQSGIKIGIGDADEMGVVPVDRKNNSVVLQVEMDNVKEFMQYLKENTVTITGGPSFDNRDEFRFGSFLDLEGNPNGLWTRTVHKLNYTKLPEDIFTVSNYCTYPHNNRTWPAGYVKVRRLKSR